MDSVLINFKLPDGKSEAISVGMDDTVGALREMFKVCGPPRPTSPVLAS